LEIRVFFFLILLFSLASIFFIEPKSVVVNKNQDRAIFEFSNFRVYGVTEISTDLILQASKASAFLEKNIVLDLNILKFENGKFERLFADRAIMIDKILSFENAKYQLGERLYSNAENIVYDLSSKEALIDSNFSFNYLSEGNTHKFYGESLVYKNSIIKADNIKAIIDLR